MSRTSVVTTVPQVSGVPAAAVAIGAAATRPAVAMAATATPREMRVVER